MASKNVILQMKLEEVLTDIMVRTGSENVIVDEAKGETLATRLAKITADINNAVANSINEEKVNTLIGNAISKLIDNAPDTYDTLLPIALFNASTAF